MSLPPYIAASVLAAPERSVASAWMEEVMSVELNYISPVLCEEGVEFLEHRTYIYQDGEQCITAKRKGRRKAEEKTRKETRKEGEHLASSVIETWEFERG